MPVFFKTHSLFKKRTNIYGPKVPPVHVPRISESRIENLRFPHKQPIFSLPNIYFQNNYTDVHYEYIYFFFFNPLSHGLLGRNAGAPDLWGDYLFIYF